MIAMNWLACTQQLIQPDLAGIVVGIVIFWHG